jgi:hypothetical protein
MSNLNPSRQNRNKPSSSPAKNGAPMQSVYDSQRCIGHIFRRGRAGFEAFDHADFSLGFFPTELEAARAIIVGASI